MDEANVQKYIHEVMKRSIAFNKDSVTGAGKPYEKNRF